MKREWIGKGKRKEERMSRKVRPYDFYFVSFYMLCCNNNNNKRKGYEVPEFVGASSLSVGKNLVAKVDLI